MGRRVVGTRRHLLFHDRPRPRVSARNPLELAAVLAGAAVILTCSEGTPPDSPDREAALIAVEYICGREFEVANANPTGVIVHFEVQAAGEVGDLALAPRLSAGVSSRTRLITVATGPLHLSVAGSAAGAAANAGVSCPAPDPPLPEPQASVGAWSDPFAWPVVAVHLNLLPDGRVLSWGRVGEPQIWDAATGGFSEIPSTTDVFCAGHAFLPDGDLLVAGGHISNDHGLPDANLFGFASKVWEPQPAMSHGRWYPTTTILSDGRALVVGGADQDGHQVSVPEIWDGAGWTALPVASLELPYYPRDFVAPNGKIFYAGELQQSRYLDPGSWTWTPLAQSLYGQREYGSAVMFRPGKVLIVGGSGPPSGPPTGTAEVIDLDETAPLWRYTGSMANPRRQFNATLLPDGRVVATGGTSAPGFSDPSGAVHAAEVWNPDDGEWTTWASNAVTRVYHSTTLLLPDGRLLHAGSGDGVGLPNERNAELFSPPYLFRGPRPIIDSAPGEVGYAAGFQVNTRDAGIIVQVSLVRLPSVTHAFDQNQRFLPLAFARSAGGLTVSAPATPDLAPPGHYMLFALNSEGVPSVATIVRLR